MRLRQSKFDSDFIKKDKIVQTTRKWYISFFNSVGHNGKRSDSWIWSIKTVKQVFENLIDVGSLRKSSPSRVYPILKDMEEKII